MSHGSACFHESPGGPAGLGVPGIGDFCPSPAFSDVERPAAEALEFGAAEFRVFRHEFPGSPADFSRFSVGKSPAVPEKHLETINPRAMIKSARLSVHNWL